MKINSKRESKREANLRNIMIKVMIILSLLVVVSIVVSFVVLFRNIDHKIVSLTSATSISSKSTNQKDDNITVTITSVADASEQIVQITIQFMAPITQSKLAPLF